MPAIPCERCGQRFLTPGPEWTLCGFCVVEEASHAPRRGLVRLLMDVRKERRHGRADERSKGSLTPPSNPASRPIG